MVHVLYGMCSNDIAKTVFETVHEIASQQLTRNATHVKGATKL